MSLPWFAFNIKDYIADTMRLSTEAHGAYLLLMLDYYETGEGPPDDDFILAAIVKLPVEQWQKHRKVIQRFFTVKAGKWHHERIAREMLEAERKHAASTARAQAGGKAKAAKIAAAKVAEATPVAAETLKPPVSASSTASSSAVSNAQALPDECTSNIEHTTTPFGRSSSAQARDNDDATDAALAPDLEEEEADIGTTIAPDWRLDASQIELCLADGLTEPSEVETQVRLFKAYNVNKGTFSTNWINTWSLWWQRHLERRQKAAAGKAKPRIVVDTTAEAKEPTDEEWERHVLNFKRDNSRWSRWIGPSPGLTGCKAPHHILTKHGIDPKTGLPIKVTT